jgi:transcription initiation factor TFIIIB Brf1 subunit/transcription initiation factor TFIIB
MLREISRDFGVRTRNIVKLLSETEYIPSLSALEYINRVSRQLNLPDNIRDHASCLIKEDTTIGNTTPIMRACCAVLNAVEAEGFHLHKRKVTSALGITTAGLLLALKRLEGLG